MCEVKSETGRKAIIVQKKKIVKRKEREERRQQEADNMNEGECVITVTSCVNMLPFIQ